MVSRRWRADVYCATTRRRRDARRELLSLVSQVVVVDREDAKDIDARFLYRAVPVGTLSTNPTLASAFHLAPSVKTKKRERALAAHLSAASGKKALTKKLLDIGALVAARGILRRATLVLHVLLRSSGGRTRLQFCRRRSGRPWRLGLLRCRVGNCHFFRS